MALVFVWLLPWDEENSITNECGKCFIEKVVNSIGTTFVFFRKEKGMGSLVVYLLRMNKALDLIHTTT